MQKIVGVRRADDKNIYYFNAGTEMNIGDRVVVSFDEFQTLAIVVRTDAMLKEKDAGEIKKIIRIATDADVKKYEELRKKAKSNIVSIKRKSLELGLMMKFVGAEYSLDNSKIVITFSSEERVDFRQFLKDLASMLKTRIELKQIGQRDEVKVCGGVGPCGEPCCCARFLNDFEHVTVKMAKIQGLSLSPTKINGICGRLMCCLGYESEVYEEILAKMPKVNSEVKTENGKGVVVYNDILRERVSVKRQAEGDTFVIEDFALEEVEFEGHPAKKPAPKKEEKKELKAEVKEEVVENSQGSKRERPQENKFNKHNEGKNKNFKKNEARASEKETKEPEVMELGAVSNQNQPNSNSTRANHKKGFHFRPKNKNKPKTYNNKN